MKKFGRFLAVGTMFSTVEEFLTVAVLKQDLGAYLFTLIVLFPAVAGLAWITSQVVDLSIRRAWVRDLGQYLLWGVIGLQFEWFVIGLSPWSNPAAPPILMAIFQLGMFSFWGTVGFAPRLFASRDPLYLRTRRSLLRFYVPWFVVTYLVVAVLAATAAPANLKFGVIISLVLLGYLLLNVFYVRHFWSQAAALPGHQNQAPDPCPSVPSAVQDVS